MEHGRLAKPLPRRSVGEAVKRKPPLFMSGHAWTMNGKNMSYLLSNDVTSGSSVDKEFDPPLEDRVKARKNADMPLAIEDEEEWNAPRVLRVSERRKGGVPAILGWSVGPFLVCEAIKYRLELLAPGDCGFKPFELWGLSDPSRDHCYGTYYWFFRRAWTRSLLKRPNLPRDAVEPDTKTARAGFRRSPMTAALSINAWSPTTLYGDCRAISA